MATQAQKNKYGNVGNEKLLPLAIGGDVAAVAVLEERGNTVTADGKLQKTVVDEYTDHRGKVHSSTRVIENGKLISVDGVNVAGNVVPF